LDAGFGNTLLLSGLISERLKDTALFKEISKWNSLLSGLLGLWGFCFSTVLSNFGQG